MRAAKLVEVQKIEVVEMEKPEIKKDNEVLVQKAFEKLSKNKTVIMIAHRLSTIKNAKHICVLTENGIEEQGNHEELMKLNGNYARLYNMQFKGEK